MRRRGAGGRQTVTVTVTVAIIGGGFSGAAVAYHLAQAAGRDGAAIVVIEPLASLGAGLAYSTPEPAHRINVPAAKMSLISDDPAHFARWLAASGLLRDDEAAMTEAGDAFPQRSVFGRYVAAMLAPLVRDGRIRHERSRALRVEPQPGGRFAISLDNGDRLLADRVVLATTHPLPAVPAPLQALLGHPGFIADPYDPSALARIAPGARVLVVGNGLTAADVVATLDRAGHVGPVTALSRHGLRSRGHPEVPAPPYGDFVSLPARSALTLLRKVRRTVAEAADAGLGWHPVLDAVRQAGRPIWSALPEHERRRLVRHLRSFWDVHRFRIAPQVEAVLARRATEGRFASVAASLESSRAGDGAFTVGYRLRGEATAREAGFDAVVNTTGPAHRGVVRQDPVQSLADAGLVRLDPVGLGLDTAPDGRAVDVGGAPVEGLYIAGPLARGTFGELMGLLEVTRYAEFIAAEIAASLEPASAPRQLSRLHS